MLRKITRPLKAWDMVASEPVALEPGVIVSNCQILRNSQSQDPYLMQFQYSGRLCSCPLVSFQPRTYIVEV